ncbi:TetR family transcriptional regulator [Alteromonas genovensis]|uniref:TetR family transcriptional regulator n=1 Tax=Alteromonas genovensis TaxID=471225 RepID=A0A6N9TKX6_9ALTE|nr:TetR/AcrR family transcriptional regulator [Alteromonas genovensis]NDW17142.1 TetR family transcriptional regulator [Alteromonas genovensis]
MSAVNVTDTREEEAVVTSATDAAVNTISNAVSNSVSNTAQSYHHGDLRTALLNAAAKRLSEHGVDSLSLRKLAEDAGVSRTAPYHHFKDKSALLSAIAAKGFSDWHSTAKRIFEQEDKTPSARFREFVCEYVGYAAANPEMYELMFGRTIWQNNAATGDLKDVAFPCFQFQVTMTKFWQHKGLLPDNQDALRLAQVTWGTLHGIARLLIDGIYADSSHIQEMCDCAADLFMQASNKA